MALVTVDARMARSSGIGTYIRQLVPRVFALREDWGCALLAQVAALAGSRLPEIPRVGLVDCSAPIYSLREQVELRWRTPQSTDLFWSPHYNIPVLNRAQLLVTVHDVLHLSRPEFVRGWHRRGYARLMFGAIRRQATRLICDSEFTAGELVRHARIDASRIRVIPLGVDDCWSHRDDVPAPHPRPYFVYVGNVKPHKNLRGLMSAFGSLLEELSHDLVIVGKKEGFITGDEGVADAAAELAGRVVFTGELNDSTVRRFVQHAEALVLPSFYEGFGLPALEAMAAGCPVLASRAASIPEVCGDAVAYFDPTDVRDIARVMKSVASSRAQRDELIAAGRERARAFTWERCAVHTAEVIEEVLHS